MLLLDESLSQNDPLDESFFTILVCLLAKVLIELEIDFTLPLSKNLAWSSGLFSDLVKALLTVILISDLG